MELSQIFNESSLIEGNYLKPCACGECNELIYHFDKHGRPRNYISGHTFTGKKHTLESRQKISQNHANFNSEKSGMWKGDKVGYGALHAWVRTHLPEPELCPICNERPPRDVACITGVYNRDLKNWQWQCRSCHERYDKIGNKAAETKRIRGNLNVKTFEERSIASKKGWARRNKALIHEVTK